MWYKVIRLLLVQSFGLMFMLMSTMKANAVYNSTADLPTLVQEANIICVGTVSNIHELDRVSFDTGFQNDGKAIGVAAQNAVADFTVEKVIKGETSKPSITISFYKNVAVGHFGPTPFTELFSGERAIVFLNPTKDKAMFSMIEPASHGRSVIPVGKSLVSAQINLAGLTPIRAILLILTQALTENDKAVRLACLQKMNSINYLLYNDSATDMGQNGAQMRTSLVEPESAKLEDFISTQIVPAVIKLATISDTEVADQAIITAAYLQNVGIIPRLAGVIKLNDPYSSFAAADALGNFRTPDAVPGLISQLSDDNAKVRERAAYALRAIRSPLAIPALLDRLDDPNEDAQYFIVTALFKATDTPHMPFMPLFHDKKAEYVSFWKKWATDHADKVKALRAQLSPGVN